jgi:lipopolysaccharide export system permease protein
MDASQFSFHQSTPGGQRGDRELGAPAMRVIVDSLSKIRDNITNEFKGDIERSFTLTKEKSPPMPPDRNKVDDVVRRVKDKVNAAKNSVYTKVDQLRYNKERINQFTVEIHKKYSLPAACIVFILLGAPLGIMTRKGGFGVAAGISLVFFLIYWAFLIGGEKLADRGLLSPFWGIWSANIFLGIIGIWLTIKSAKERMVLDFSFLKKLLPKSLRFAQEDDENS